MWKQPKIFNLIQLQLKQTSHSKSNLSQVWAEPFFVRVFSYVSKSSTKFINKKIKDININFLNLVRIPVTIRNYMSGAKFYRGLPMLFFVG